MALEIAAYEPDIPQNLGALLRLGACLAVRVHIIAPCSFPMSDARLRRVGMDYLAGADYTLHESWARFLDFAQVGGRRIVLLTTAADTPYHRFAFLSGDILLLGRESAGVPQEVHGAAQARVRVPMAEGARSLNVAMAAGIVLAEGLRQCNALPGDTHD